MVENTDIFERLRIRPEVAKKLGFYVYVYVDPRNSDIFYVGKGCHGRALSHLDEVGESAKNRRIAELKEIGIQPRIDILAHNIQNEATALLVEAAVIDALWLGKSLTNKVRGYRSLDFGRVPLDELVFQYAAKPITTISEPVMLIRINKLYRPDMNPSELYEVTRSAWTCGSRRNNARYALAVFESVVREVYRIDAWHPAGTHENSPQRPEDVQRPKRWEFSGEVSPELSTKYKGGSVEKFFPKGAQLPFTYVNC